MVQFSDRINAIRKSKKLFQHLEHQVCPHCHKEFKASINVTKTFEAYQELVAAEDRSIFINTFAMPLMPERATPMSGFNSENRPKCPKCGKPMMFMPHVGQLSKESNPAGWQTAWVCPDTTDDTKECWYIHYSKKPVSYWVSKVKAGPITELRPEVRADAIELKRPCEKNESG